MENIKYTLENQVVLITGGSQGLGKQFALKYYTETIRSKIVIVSRAADKLERAITDITKGLVKPKKLSRTTTWYDKDRIAYISCDLSAYESVTEMFDVLFINGVVPSQVLACAGGSTPKLFKNLTGDELEAGVKMNYLTTLFVAHKVAQLVPHCHLILFSSETAFFPFIGYAQYAPLKGSIKALASILRQELSGIRISCVYPGNFQSEGYALEELTKPSITKEIEGASEAISCEKCCNRIVGWLSRGYDDIIVDLIGWFLMSTDMGLNKHHTYSFLWIVQLIIGTLANLLIVPIYMIKCSYDIKQWRKREKKSLMRD